MAATVVILLLLSGPAALSLAMSQNLSVEIEGDDINDFPISCDHHTKCVYNAQENTTVLMPCGKYQRAPGILFTYYLKDSLKVLVNSTLDFARFDLSWRDDGTTVCCAPNSSSAADFLRDSACYYLNVTYAPVIVSTDMAPGVRQWPVYGEPLIRICPLQSNPPSHYTWRRYRITGNTGLNISSDVSFSEDGRRLVIDAYRPEEHNGVYVCEASNALGRREYSDASLFYLHAEFCSRFKTGNISMTIAPSGELSYKLGDKAVLNCSFYPVQETGQKPNWFFLDYDKNGNVSAKYVDSSVAHQEYRYDKARCIWKNTLTISNFSEELSGTYSCGYSYHVINQTLRLLKQDEDITPEPKLGHHGYNWKVVIAIVMVPVSVVAVCFGLCVCITICVKWKRRRRCYTTSKEPPSTGFLHDVFISAHDEVRELVQHKLLPLLENHTPPYSVCWHLRDFVVGVPINEQITSSILKSRKILFVFSEHFTESPFCCSELDQALDRFQTTRTRCLLPIVLSEGRVPERVKSTLTYWPLVNLNENNLSDRITKILGEPMEKTLTSRCITNRTEVNEHTPLLS